MSLLEPRLLEHRPSHVAAAALMLAIAKCGDKARMTSLLTLFRGTVPPELRAAAAALEDTLVVRPLLPTPRPFPCAPPPVCCYRAARGLWAAAATLKDTILVRVFLLLSGVGSTY